jgi:2-iminobutanoate/2-iminopropanoate deaminase
MGRKAVTSDKVARQWRRSHMRCVRERPCISAARSVRTPVTGKLVEGGVAAQTEQTFRNLEAVLEAAKKTFSDVIKVNVFLTDMKDFSAMNAVYEKQFEKPYPARTTVAVVALPLGAAVEIELIAR